MGTDLPLDPGGRLRRNDFRPKGDRSDDKYRIYRKNGFKVVGTFAPFVFYFVLSTFDNSFMQLLASPELPMASAILCVMGLYATKRASDTWKGRIESNRITIPSAIFGSLLLSILALAGWIFIQDSVPLWLSIVNLAVAISVSMLSFGFMAAFEALERLPHESGIQR